MSSRNIVLLIADDLGRNITPYASLPPHPRGPSTPSLSRLASSGTLFSHAFASTASCSGSRSTIYTGQHTHQNGQYGLNHGRHHFTTFDHIPTAPKLLNEQDYLTGIIGKLHVGPECVYPWVVCELSHTRDVSWVSDRASAFFSRAKDESRPFFLTIGYIDPHRDQTRGGFGNDKDLDSRVKRASYTESEVQIPEYLTDAPGTRLEMAEYYNSISRLDQGVGMILDALEQTGLADSTLVIFLSDNGPPFINSKTTLYDSGVCLPFILRNPLDPASHGTVNPNMVSYIDIVPTILDWTNHPNPAHASRVGRSILPILSTTTPLPSWSTVYGSHTFHEMTNYWPTRFIRNRRYKYHRNIAWRLDFPFAADIYASLSWEDMRNANPDPSSGVMLGQRRLKDYIFRPPEELYDLGEDPHEVHNLAADPAHARVLEDMRGQMEAWQRRTEDPWLYRDGVSMLEMRRYVKAGMKIPDKWDLDADDPRSKDRDSFSPDLPWGIGGIEAGAGAERGVERK